MGELFIIMRWKEGERENGGTQALHGLYTTMQLKLKLPGAIRPRRRGCLSQLWLIAIEKERRAARAQQRLPDGQAEDRMAAAALAAPPPPPPPPRHAYIMDASAAAAAGAEGFKARLLSESCCCCCCSIQMSSLSPPTEGSAQLSSLC